MTLGKRKCNCLEGTASVMFTYSLLRAVHYGLLPKDYLKPVQAGYAVIVSNFLRVGAAGDVNLTQCF